MQSPHVQSAVCVCEHPSPPSLPVLMQGELPSEAAPWGHGAAGSRARADDTQCREASFRELIKGNMEAVICKWG